MSGNPLNEIKTWGSNNYFYDANGNTLSGDGTRSYKWDAENRLVEIDHVETTGGKTQFSYDGAGGPSFPSILALTLLVRVPHPSRRFLARGWARSRLSANNPPTLGERRLTCTQPQSLMLQSS